ncbi:MAG: response regulator transcription factor [Balneolaceae bacterium]
MAKSRVVIADETDIDLSGIQSILEKLKSVEVVAVASTATEACELFEKHSADLLMISSGLTDMNLRKIIEQVTQNQKDAKVIVLSSATDTTHLNQSLNAGVSGYLLKTIPQKKLREAVQNVVKGEKVFSPSIAKLMTEKYAHLARQKSSGVQSAEPVTPREREVLQLIADGYTSREIAKKLYISPRTVETHRANLLQKLKIKNTAGLVRYALEKGM